MRACLHEAALATGVSICENEAVNDLSIDPDGKAGAPHAYSHHCPTDQIQVRYSLSRPATFRTASLAMSAVLSCHVYFYSQCRTTLVCY